MNRFVLEIWDNECQHCTFYTVRKGDPEEETLAPLSETDHFFDRFGEDPIYSEAARELLSFLIDAIGDTHGPHPAFFNRNEREVEGLPLKGKHHIGAVQYHFPRFPLRLYAMKIHQHIVVLFNGGIKDGETNQTSSLESKWNEARRFARTIDNALFEKELLIDQDGREILHWNDEHPITLEY